MKVYHYFYNEILDVDEEEGLRLIGKGYTEVKDALREEEIKETTKEKVKKVYNKKVK